MRPNREVVHGLFLSGIVGGELMGSGQVQDVAKRPATVFMVDDDRQCVEQRGDLRDGQVAVEMRRMTTGRWMILVASVSFAFGLLMFLRRVAAGKVASFMQKTVRPTRKRAIW
jgi:hypothetical protein